MEYLPKQKWAKILVIAAFIILAGISVYLFFGRILSILLPFALAFLLGRVLQSPLNKLHKRIGLHEKLLGFILITIIIFFVGFVCFLLANQLVSEVQRLFEKLTISSESILSSAADILDKTGKRFPFIYEYLDGEVINGTLTEVLKNTLSALTSRLAAVLTAFVKALPDIGLFFVVFVIAAYYFTMDYDRIVTAAKDILPDRLKAPVRTLAGGLKNAGTSYIKAYSILLLVTFAQLFVGFLVLQINYATTLAVIIALLDMLPVIGTGTILVPWGIICIIMGDYPQGIGILVLFGIISLVREVTEPKIIGNSIGMHPLLTLVAMYVGYKLFGLWGLLILPPALIPVKSVLSACQNKKIHH